MNIVITFQPLKFINEFKSTESETLKEQKLQFVTIYTLYLYSSLILLSN